MLTASRLDDTDIAALARTSCGEVTRRTTASGSSTSAARARPTCCAAALDDPQPAPDAVVSPAATRGRWPSWPSATSAASPSCPSAAAPPSSAASTPTAARTARYRPRPRAAPPGSSTSTRSRCSRPSAPARTGPQVEELLSAHGYTLGHFPQSYEYATIGGYAATRSSGQASRGYGRFDDLVHALRIATPVGELSSGRAPASAAGPDLRELFLGSEGAFGVLTEVTVRIRPMPGRHDVRGVDVPRLRRRARPPSASSTQLGIRPTVLRLSDETETRVNAAMGGASQRDARMPRRRDLRGRRRRRRRGDRARTLDAVFAAARREARAARIRARSWERGRFASPALRDALLDAGVLAETLETATTWRQLDRAQARRHRGAHRRA